MQLREYLPCVKAHRHNEPLSFSLQEVQCHHLWPFVWASNIGINARYEDEKGWESTLEHSIGTAESDATWSEIWWYAFDLCRRPEATRLRPLTKSLIWARRFVDANFLVCDLGIRRLKMDDRWSLPQLRMQWFIYQHTIVCRVHAFCWSICLMHRNRCFGFLYLAHFCIYLTARVANYLFGIHYSTLFYIATGVGR